ncbi:MAG: single-stranded DNA-binding protein [Alcaligenaceae bacterium]|nr:single-stranded DNA-binding protein [Alcaligenaceae bacterium]
MSVNKVILVGHLGADPESRATPAGLQVCNLSLATNHVSYDREGNKNESTEWHRVVFFGRQAEICEQYLRKGSQIYVEGRLQTRKYTDRDNIERYSTDIVGERMQMLGGRDINSNPSGSGGDGPPDFGSRSRSRGTSSGGGFEDNSRPMPGTGSKTSAPQRPPTEPPRQQVAPKARESFDDLDDDLPF